MEILLIILAAANIILIVFFIIYRQLPAKLNQLETIIQTNLINYENKLSPFIYGMDNFLKHFSHLKDNAGKIGELSLDIILSELDSSHILKNQSLENGKIVEFIIKIGNDWVIIDSKNSTKESYIKKEIIQVSELYLNKKIKESPNHTASFGLIFVSDTMLPTIINDIEIRKLMITYKVWVVSPSNFYYQLFLFNYLSQNNRFSSPSEFLVIASKITGELTMMRKLVSTIDLQVNSLVKNKDELSKKIEIIDKLLQLNS